MAGSLILGLVVAGSPSFPCGPCGPKCHDKWGDTLEAVFSGITDCSGCYTIGVSPQDVKFTFTGVNGGPFTATWDAGSSTWISLAIGTVTISVYGSSDGTCTGMPTDFTQNVDLSISCSGNNLLNINVNSGGTFNVNLFQSAAGTLGDVIPNSFVLGDCGSGTLSFTSAYGGVVTVSL